MLRASRRPNLCSVLASGAIICPKITCAPEKSAPAPAAPAATTRTPRQSSLPIRSSDGCGAYGASKPLPRLDPLGFRYHPQHHRTGAPRSLLAARDGAAMVKIMLAAGRPPARPFRAL